MDSAKNRDRARVPSLPPPPSYHYKLTPKQLLNANQITLGLQQNQTCVPKVTKEVQIYSRFRRQIFLFTFAANTNVFFTNAFTFILNVCWFGLDRSRMSLNKVQ